MSSFQIFLQRTFLIIAGLLMGVVNAIAGTGASPLSTNWQPKVGERMTRLSVVSLERSVEKDFSKSPLAHMIRGQADQIRVKEATIARLRSANRRAEGSVSLEQNHRLLHEKVELVQLLGNQLSLERKAWQMRFYFYSEILRKSQLSKGEAVKVPPKLRPDQKMVVAPDLPQSHAARYAAVLEAKRKLINHIARHPVTIRSTEGGHPANREKHLRRLVRQGQAMLALLGEEERVLGLMSKLVALDAIGFAAKRAHEERRIVTASAARYLY